MAASVDVAAMTACVRLGATAMRPTAHDRLISAHNVELMP